MRPALLKGLTFALVAVSAVAVLRLPVTLLRPADGDRVDVLAPATVPSHLVRLPSPAAPAERAKRRSVRPAPSPAPAARALPKPTRVRARPAAPARTTPTPRPVVRIIRAEPSTQQALPAPAPVVTPTPAAPVPLAAPPAAQVAFEVTTERAAQPDERSKAKGREKASKAGRGKRAAASAPVSTGPQLLAVASQPAPAVAVAPPAAGETDAVAGGDEHGGKHGRDHGHDKRG